MVGVVCSSEENKHIIVCANSFFVLLQNNEMSENEKLRNMVLAFRMSELQCLMVFAGKSKAGKKTDLQASLH
jgi:hypothetical protein